MERYSPKAGAWRVWRPHEHQKVHGPQNCHHCPLFPPTDRALSLHSLSPTSLLSLPFPGPRPRIKAPPQRRLLGSAPTFQWPQPQALALPLLTPASSLLVPFHPAPRSTHDLVAMDGWLYAVGGNGRQFQPQLHPEVQPEDQQVGGRVLHVHAA